MEQFLAERGQGLMRTAVLLTGSVDAGEDLLQTALERLLRKWHRLDGDPEGYLRRTLYNLATDGLRRQGRWRRKLRPAGTRRRTGYSRTLSGSVTVSLMRGGQVEDHLSAAALPPVLRGAGPADPRASTLGRAGATSPIPDSEVSCFERDVMVIGGCGHIGLPLAIAFADLGARVGIYDASDVAVGKVNAAQMPFDEPGAADVLKRVVAAGRLKASAGPGIVATAEHLIVVIGTPVDEHLNPDHAAIPNSLSGCADHLRDGQILILRSTVYPGVTALVEKMITRLGVRMDVAFCPERIAEGKAMSELSELPQIVSSRTPRRRPGKRFVQHADARAGAHDAGGGRAGEAVHQRVAVHQVRDGKPAVHDGQRPRARLRANPSGPHARLPEGCGHAQRRFSLPGPCLFKDTMQLAAFNNNNFALGHTAMTINEGLPLYLVYRLEQRFDLRSMTVGILGMAFKGGSDDIRSSLSYKLKRILAFKADAVLCSDPYVTADSSLRPLDEILALADLLVIGAPHPEYRDLGTGKPVADIWNVLGRGVRV